MATDTGELEKFDESAPSSDITVPVRGRDLIAALDELTQLMGDVHDREGVVRRAISLLYQARGRTILLLSDNGQESQLPRLWR